MDPVRFDTLTRTLSTDGSRRRVLRASVAAFASGFWLTGRALGASPVCLPQGDPCSQSSQCCSGRCNKRRKKCTALPNKAHGCTIDDASCADAGSGATECPELPNGICRITRDGRPVCAVSNTVVCKRCRDNSTCVDSLGIGALCVRCETCPSGTTCICPFFVKQK